MASKEQRKIRHWLDIEFSWLHIYILVVIWLLVDGFVPHLIVACFLIGNFAYMVKRVVWLMKVDKDYLKVPPTHTKVKPGEE